MPSTYTLNNGIELIGTGEQSGTWGNTTNTNLELLDVALDGQVTITAASAGSSGSPNSLPITDGSASDGRNRLVNITSGTDLGSTVFYQLTPNDAEKIIYIRNSLNTQDLIVFQGTYNSSNDYLIPNGTTAVIFFNGAGSGAVAANVLSTLQVDALNVESAASTTAITIDNTATDGDPILGFALSGTNTFTMGVDDGDSDKFKIGTSAIGTDTRLTITSSGAVGVGEDSPDVFFHIKTADSGGVMTIESTNASSSSGPNLNLLRTSASPADDDNIGKINFQAYDDSSNNTVYANIQTLIRDTTDTTEDGRMLLNTILNGALVSRVELDNTETVINENSYDLDFRVESDGNANMLFVDGGNNKVGVGTNTLQATMHVYSGDSGASVHSNANELFVENSTDAGITIGSGNTSSGSLRFADDGGTGRGIVFYDHSNDNLVLYTGGSERVRINSTEIVFNDDSADTDFRVESDGQTHMLYVDAGNNVVSIAQGTPVAKWFQIGGDAITTNKPSVSINAADDSGVNTSLLIRGGSPTIAFDQTSGGAGRILMDDSKVRFYTGTLDSTGTEVFTVGQGSGSETVANEGSIDIDFRVESDSNSNMFVVDAAQNQVGVGAAPDGSAALDAVGRTLRAANIYTKYAQYAVPTATYVDVYWNDDTITLDSGYIYRFQLATLSTGTNTGAIYWVWFDDSVWHVDIESRHGTSSNNPQGRVDSSKFQIFTNHGSTYTVGVHSEARAAGTDDNTRSSIGLPGFITAYGNDALVFNEEGEDLGFRVESDANSHMLFVDAGNDHVNIGSSTDRGGLLNVDGATKGIVVRTTDATAMELIYANNDAGFGPLLDFNRPSSGPAANDFLGRINFTGKNNADEAVTYAQIHTQTKAVGDGTESGRMKLGVMQGGTFVGGLDIVGGSEININEDSADIDFRVESDSNANMLFVDAGENKVKVATSSTVAAGSAQLQVGGMGIRGAMGITTNTDTGIPINQGSAGGTALLIASRNYGAGTATQSQVAMIQFYYDGDNTPALTHIAGSTGLVSVGTNAGSSPNQTLTLTGAGGNTTVTFLMNC